MCFIRGHAIRYLTMSSRSRTGLKGWEAPFQDFAFVLVLKEVGPSRGTADAMIAEISKMKRNKSDITVSTVLLKENLGHLHLDSDKDTPIY